MMAKRSQSGGGSGVVAVLGFVLVLGFIVKFFWWLIGIGAAIGLFFVVRYAVRQINERREAAALEAEEIAYRADRQNRMAQRGDSRGVYGVAGAELMRDVLPLSPEFPDGALPEGVTIAALATTPAGLDRLRTEKPPGWRWALFTSVLDQRRAEVRERIRDCQLGFAVSPGMPLDSGVSVAQFVTFIMDDLGKLVERVESFMLTPAFMAVFGQHGDESTADADGIVQVANRLMDYHLQFLDLADRCRVLDVPSRYTGLVRDCLELTLVPLEGYETFVDDLIAVVKDMPDLMIHGRGMVQADPIALHMSIDDVLMKRLTKGVRAAAKS